MWPSFCLSFHQPIIWSICPVTCLFKVHLHYIRHPGPNLYAIETIELMFGVYTDPSLSLRFLSRNSVSELVATCSDFLRHGRPSTSGVMKRACSKALVHVVATKFGLKWSWTRMTLDPSLGCSVNTILSGSRTRSRTRMLGQCKWKCALT